MLTDACRWSTPSYTSQSVPLLTCPAPPRAVWTPTPSIHANKVGRRQKHANLALDGRIRRKYLKLLPGRQGKQGIKEISNVHGYS